MKQIFIILFILVTNTIIGFTVTDDEIINQVMVLSNITGADDLLEELENLIGQLVNDPNDYYSNIGFNFTSCMTYLCYFRGTTISTLAMCIPLVSGTIGDTGTLKGKLAQRLKTEVTNYFFNQAYWDWEHYTSTGNPYVYPANYRKDIAWNHGQRVGPHWEKMYALWCYGYYTGDWTTIQNNWSFIRDRYNQGYKTPDNNQKSCIISYRPCDSTNCYIMSTYRNATNDLCNGLIGYVRMADRFNDSTRTQARTEAKSALADVLNRVNVSWNSAEWGDWAPGYNLSPEIGRWINDNTTARNNAQTRLDEAANAGALKGHWWCGFMNNFGKNSSNYTEDMWGVPNLSHELFLGRAWMLQETASSLRQVKPWHVIMGSVPEYRDMLYLRSLIALISRHATITWVNVN